MTPQGWVHSVFLDSPSPVVLAHQGFSPPGRGISPNTMGAFKAAVDAGTRYLETDVRATADGVVVAFHDDTVERTTDGTGAIGDLTWQRVSQLTVRPGGTRDSDSTAQHPVSTAQRVPRLCDLFDAFPDAGFNLDVKTADVIEPLTDLLTERAAGGDDILARTCIASFSDRRRRATLRPLPGGVCSSAGVATVLFFWLCTRLPRPLAGLLTGFVGRDVQIFQVPVRYGRFTIVDARFVQAAHRARRHVHVWTVNDERTMRELLALGVDGLVSDRTDLALASVAAHTRGSRG